jgi:hypothetical protein
MSSNLFIDNKYTKWYYGIINSALAWKSDGYTEKHRIIPGCMGGKYVPGNVAHLTAREHFVCHLLLTKMVTKEPYLSKLKYAAILLYSVHDQKISSRLYEALKSNIKQTPEWIEKRTAHFKGRVSPTKGMVAWNKGLTKETNESVRRASVQPNGTVPWNKGVPAAEEHKNNIKHGMKNANISYEHMRKMVKCNCCGVESTQSAITRYHNDKCKHK